MMLMTTISSISVNPRCPVRRIMNLPILASKLPRLIFRAVEAGAFRLCIDVENALPAP